MNKHNVKVVQAPGHWLGEWADRAPDDDERYADDAIIITAMGETEKQMWANLANAYDRWIDETRR